MKNTVKLVKGYNSKGEHRLFTTKEWYVYGHRNHSGFPYQYSKKNYNIKLDSKASIDDCILYFCRNQTVSIVILMLQAAPR